MQSLRRHAGQCPVVLCNALHLASVAPPNLPCEGRPVKAFPKLERKSAVGAGRSPLRFWLLLAYTKSDSPQAKYEKGIEEVRFFAALRMTDRKKQRLRVAAAMTKLGGGMSRTAPPTGNTRRIEKKRRTANKAVLYYLVREGGVEPPRPCEHWHLKPASLPIPPLAQVVVIRHFLPGQRCSL